MKKNKVRTNEDIKWGKKMIKISIQFFTNEIPENLGLKTAWAKGAIHMVANKQRGLEHNHVFFYNAEEIPKKIQVLLDKNDVTLVRPPEQVEKVKLI